MIYDISLFHISLLQLFVKLLTIHSQEHLIPSYQSWLCAEFQMFI